MISSTFFNFSSENLTIIRIISYAPRGPQTRLCIHLPSYKIQRTHDDDRIAQHRPLRHLRIGLVIDKTGPAEMQPIRRPPPIADQIKTQLPIPAFHTAVHLPGRDLRLTHHDLEMIDQGLHLSIYVLLLRQIISRRIGMKYLGFRAFHIENLSVRLLDDPHGLPHLAIPHQETIITIPRRSHGYLKVKVLVAAVRRMYPYVIVDPGRP